MATDANGNVYVSTWNPSNCHDDGGGRCQLKQLTPGGSVNHAPFESWNGLNVFDSGLAVDSNGAIYEAVWNGSAQNSIRKRTSIGATSTQFVSPAALGVASAGQGQISGMTIDANNNLYVAMPQLGMIKKVTPAGVVSTYASDLGVPGAIMPVINKTTGVLYFLNSSKQIMQIPAGGGTPTLVAQTTASYDANPASGNYGWGVQLAIDDAGYIYARNAMANSLITQISPTGTLVNYLASNVNVQGPNSSLGQNDGAAITYHNGFVYAGGASMYGSNIFKMGVASYGATLLYTPTVPGSFSIGATLTPSSGSFAGSSGSGTLVVRPASPSVPDLATDSDTGASSIDDITSDTTPRIEVPGTYTNGDTITVTATKTGSTSVTCSYVIPATGCDLGSLAAGTWSITATHTHPTGGTSVASNALPITIDGTAPSSPSGVDLMPTSDTGTSSTDNITSDNTPTLSATGGSTGDTMTISATNGATTLSCTYVIGTATECTLPTLTDGTWDITATLTDSLDNTSSASSSLPITIATSPPSRPAPDLLPSSDSGASNTDNITNDTTPEISIPGSLTGDVVTVSATNGASTVTCTYTTGAVTSCSLPTSSEGTWTVSATIVDSAGNSGTATGTLSITIDLRVPTSSDNANNNAGLPTSSDTNTRFTISNGTNSMTGRLTFSTHAAANGVTAVVFTVYNDSGKIVSVTTKKVRPTDKSVSLTVRNDGSLSTMRAHTTNAVGVSISARTGANIAYGRTSRGKLPNGRPALQGEMLGTALYFMPNSATLTPRTIAILDGIAKRINSQGGRLYVSGFARKNGIDTSNYLRQLSEQRAFAVSMYLSLRGVRIWTIYQGFGAVTKSVGTPKERRVELRWVSS
jgi:outer membrane protein OmpA-like peptidoglycan-associated protein